MWPASLDGLAAIVENGIPCDQAVLLTGEDFPARSNEIKARLGGYREYSFCPCGGARIGECRTGPLMRATDHPIATFAWAWCCGASTLLLSAWKERRSGPHPANRPLSPIAPPVCLPRA
jgi:hypothetical protein